MTPERDPELDLGQLGTEFLTSIGAVRRRIRRVAPEARLPTSQVELLSCILDEPGLSVSALATTLHLAPNTASTLLRGLGELGLITRIPDPADRRVPRFVPTQAGLDHVEGMRDRGGAVITAALYQLREEDREILARAVPVLRLLVDLLT